MERYDLFQRIMETLKCLKCGNTHSVKEYRCHKGRLARTSSTIDTITNHYLTTSSFSVPICKHCIDTNKIIRVVLSALLTTILVFVAMSVEDNSLAGFCYLLVFVSGVGTLISLFKKHYYIGEEMAAKIVTNKLKESGEFDVKTDKVFPNHEAK